MCVQRLTDTLKDEAYRLGFHLAGACLASPAAGIGHFRQWLAAGYAGQMKYLVDRAEAYEHPHHVLDGAKSILMLAVDYRTVEPAEVRPGQGKVSRYAWGDDYHDVVRDRLRHLADFHRRLTPQAKVRGVVDTAPLLERDFAQQAGLGWIGKNTLLLNQRLGSWFFLAALLTSEELQYDEPVGAGHCGTCRACLDACPTGALVEPYRLDARKCISYLTIELRGSVPVSLRESQGDWVLGCDACQEVCPWNRRQRPCESSQRFAPAAGMNPGELAELFLLDDEAFRRRFRRSPLWRPQRRGMLRNAAIALGNRADTVALPSLMRGLHDLEPLVRAACAWALGRYDAPEARAAIRQRRDIETDGDVRAEIEAALQAAPPQAEPSP